ncbi:MAG TPA: contractile injection system protein, VgrG/Pvc8 family [Kofleriaceae bacterium]|nr:contractile injection system protein, VgrG/Pvc8 family [Kofleriaceae bacterium]
MPEQSTMYTAAFEIKIDGKVFPTEQVEAVIVDRDLDQPDMCAISVPLSAPDLIAAVEKVKLGNAVEVKFAPGGSETLEMVFQGEIAGIEASYASGENSRAVLRAFNRLHRLLRGRNSKTYQRMKDSDIASQIAQNNGLTASCSTTTVIHEHIYQHNQTDLEFLRDRARVLGFEVVVEDKTLRFRKPEVDRDSGITLRLDEGLLNFSPRLSSARVVQKVQVRGWDPVKKEEVIGEASALSSRLGDATGASRSKSAFGEVTTYSVNQPIASAEEAKNLAEAKLADHLMSYITGEGLCIGRPDLLPGMVVSISLSAQSGTQTKTRFDGKYMLVAVCHRFTGTSGYNTAFRFRRDAENPT